MCHRVLGEGQTLGMGMGMGMECKPAVGRLLLEGSPRTRVRATWCALVWPWHPFPVMDWAKGREMALGYRLWRSTCCLEWAPLIWSSVIQ